MTACVVQYGAARVKFVVVYPDSGIQLSPRTPYQLEMHIMPERKPVTVGEVLRIPFELAVKDGGTISHVNVSVGYDAKALRLLSGARMSFAAVRGHTRGLVAFRALRPGGSMITFDASSYTNSPSLVVRVTVLPRNSSVPWLQHPTQVALVLLGIAAASIVIYSVKAGPPRRARRDSSEESR